MADKRMSHEAVVAELRDGMTIGIGGWGSRRKPMSLVRAIARSDLKNLTIVSFAGPDVGLLLAAGKVAKVVYGFASLDSIPLEPVFRKARQEGRFEAVELDEGMVQWGLRAAAYRLPFLPIRAGLGSDVMKINPWLRTVTSPYGDGEELVAMKAIELDAALVHLNRSDARGNAQSLGPDPFFDLWFCRAARRAYVSCERIVSAEEMVAEGGRHAFLLKRMEVSGVVEAPGGASFTSCEPDYERDEVLQSKYAQAARDPDALDAFVREYLNTEPGL